jgi:hypothetical protein
MRKVEILYQRGNRRPWVAVDADTKQELLRLIDYAQLMRLCEGLGWRVLNSEPKAGTAKLRK